MKNQSLVSTNNQPIKMIDHLETYSLFDMLEQLNSWQHTLNFLDELLSQNQRPLNKKMVAGNYYACSQVFTAFHTDFSQTIPKIEKLVNELKLKE
jgi:hypothetical protein